MSVFFAGEEILEMAIRIEENGKAFYESLAKSAKEESLRRLFTYLAGEEKKHIAAFQGLRRLSKETIITAPYEWEEAATYLKALADTKVFTDYSEGTALMKKAETPLGAIDVAISFEKESILFYDGMLDIVTEQGKKVVEEVIEQEKDHIRKLSELRTELTSFRH